MRLFSTAIKRKHHADPLLGSHHRWLDALTDPDLL
jgi:hypothetical protein